MQSQCQPWADCCRQRLGAGEEIMFHKEGRKRHWTRGFKDVEKFKMETEQQRGMCNIPGECSKATRSLVPGTYEAAQKEPQSRVFKVMLRDLHVFLQVMGRLWGILTQSNSMVVFACHRVPWKQCGMSTVFPQREQPPRGQGPVHCCTSELASPTTWTWKWRFCWMRKQWT